MTRENENSGLEHLLDGLGARTRDEPDALFEDRLAARILGRSRGRSRWLVVGGPLAVAAGLGLIAMLWNVPLSTTTTPSVADAGDNSGVGTESGSFMMTSFDDFDEIDAELSVLEAEMVSLESDDLDDWAIEDWSL